MKNFSFSYYSMNFRYFVPSIFANEQFNQNSFC